MQFDWLSFLAFVITQALIVIVPVAIFRIENRPEIKRIKQQIEDKKSQIENNKNMLVQICCSNMEQGIKQAMIDYHKNELNKLKKEILELNEKLPKRQQEAIKLNVSEILEAVSKFKKEGGDK